MKLRTVALLLSLIFCSHLMAEPPLTPLNQKRVAEVKELLLEQPIGYGAHISDRAVWDKLAARGENQKILKYAEDLLTKPFPVWNDSLFIQYLETGIRKQADDMYKARIRRLSPLVIAECMENEGRFIAAIDRTLNELCTQPTWTMVAHDPNLDNFWGRAYHVDLGSASLADELGQVLFMMGDKLPAHTVERVKRTLNERVYQPVLNAYRTLDCKGSKMSWITRNNNWNLVCVAGVTNSILASCDDLDLRAEVAAAAEKYIQYGIEGFFEDGYCPEGIGYYNYGFSYLIRLREGLYRATAGAIDLFEHPRMQKIATFGQRSEIINGVYPAITDCRMGVTPSHWVMWYCNTAYGWNVENPVSTEFTPGSMVDDLIRNFSEAPCKITDKNADQTIGLRSYFDKADVLTCRPERDQWNNALAIAIKGGSNHESHNHNDVASYTIAAGNEMVMGDMGGPTAYTAKTFSNVRYTLYPMFSSFGHPVPLIGGVQQHESAKAVAELKSKRFRDSKDEITYEIASAYAVDGLKSVTRQFSYDRKKEGEVTVTDRFSAKSPLSFETAICSRQKVEIRDNKVYLVGKNTTVEVTIKSSVPYTLKEETVSDYAFTSFTRVGILLDKEVSRGEIKLTYKLIKK